MNIVDSSAWLEFFADGKHADRFANPIKKTSLLLIPTIILYEVFKKILREKDEETALRCIAHMKLGTVIDLDLDLALRAAAISMHTKLPMADSIILAVSEKFGAIIWTQDADFKNLPRVKFFQKVP